MMKLTNGILLLGMTATLGYAQNPNILQTTKAKVNGAQAPRVAEENKALAPPAAPGAAKPGSPYSAASKDAAKGPATTTQANVGVEDKKALDPKKDDKKTINFSGRRDPFVSPVVNRAAAGSGCSTGKKCLAIDQIALRGVVRADNGMIAVVVNAADKAYFLRENDPVFNGYVVKITGDAIIFKETSQDKLGKPFVREITKRIITPAV